LRRIGTRHARLMARIDALADEIARRPCG